MQIGVLRRLNLRRNFKASFRGLLKWSAKETKYPLQRDPVTIKESCEGQKMELNMKSTTQISLFKIDSLVWRQWQWWCPIHNNHPAELYTSKESLWIWKSSRLASQSKSPATKETGCFDRGQWRMGKSHPMGIKHIIGMLQNRVQLHLQDCCLRVQWQALLVHATWWGSHNSYWGHWWCNGIRCFWRRTAKLWTSERTNNWSSATHFVQVMSEL